MIDDIEYVVVGKKIPPRLDPTNGPCPIDRPRRPWLVPTPVGNKVGRLGFPFNAFKVSVDKLTTYTITVDESVFLPFTVYRSLQ